MIVERTCVICNKPYTKPHSRVLTCSPGCSEQLNILRRRQRYQRSTQRSPEFLEKASAISEAAWKSLCTQKES